MAEIKSTMELVMERAARMGKASPEEMQREESHKIGMQLAADYLKGTSTSLSSALSDIRLDQQLTTRKGMIESLLHNLFLARDELGHERMELAIKGIVELSDRDDELTALCNELQSVVKQYTQHREQLYQQLSDQVRMQYEQALAQQTGMDAEGLKNLNIDPTMEPKFKEEWSRVETELDSQYGQALNQYKEQLQQRLLS